MEDKIIKLKAEIFDIQTQIGTLQAYMQQKLAELNKLLQEQKKK